MFAAVGDRSRFRVSIINRLLSLETGCCHYHVAPYLQQPVVIEERNHPARAACLPSSPHYGAGRLSRGFGHPSPAAASDG